VDGEGCITISRAAGSESKRYINPRFWLVVYVANTHEPLIDWLQAAFGGHKRLRSAKPPRRTSWHWAVQGPQAANLLRAVRPYLIVKAREADIAMRFQEGVSVPRVRFAQALTAEQMAEREAARLALMEAKRQ
jgi:hypothetical protein